jgi:hypothetical protein
VKINKKIGKKNKEKKSKTRSGLAYIFRHFLLGLWVYHRYDNRTFLFGPIGFIDDPIICLPSIFLPDKR